MNRFFAVSAALLLAACGFHLKGTQPYDRLPVEKWRIVGDLQQPIGTALHRAGAGASDSADVMLRVSAETKKDAYTITRAAQLNEYLLLLNVEAQAYRDGKPWGAPMSLQIRRTIPYSDSMVLGKQEEEATIWREMREDAAEQLVRRLPFLPAADPQ